MKPILIIICILGVLNCSAQSEKPAVLLSQREMTANGGQPYDEFYWLNSNDASLTKTGVAFPQTGSYRFDVSAYAVNGTSQIDVLIDGSSKGTISITLSSIAIYSLFIDQIVSGTHTITIQLGNFNAGANHCRAGLFYFTQTALQTPYVLPVITHSSLPSSGQYLTSDHFRSKLLRGFNLSTVYTLNDLKAKNIPAARETGANIGRYWISVSHLPGSSDYYFSNSSGTNLGSTPLETLDSAVRIAEEVGMYIMITLEVFPDQADADLWGDNTEAINRRNGIKAIWQQIATRYKDKTIVAGYDLINEPRSNFNYAEYLRWQCEMVEAIRSIDPNHIITIECLRNNMYAMMLPLPYSNIIYSPHSYSPLSLTHQGINAYLGSTTAQTRRKYPDTGVDISDLSSPLDNVRTFSQRFHAPVWVGELSCVNWAPLNNQGEWTSTKWIDDDISLLEAEGWSWCYHAWREFQAWDAEIPSSYYNSYTFTNGAPFTSSGKPSDWSSARTSTAPTIVMLKKWFGLNASIPTGNIPPTVNITSPEANSAYDSTQFIVVEVEATDSDGSINKVEVYNHDTLLATKASAPYTFVINNLSAGNYELTVTAYDNNGDTTTSATVPVTVSNILLTVLPVQLVFFNVAERADGEIELKWRTSTESTMSHFEVEYLEKTSNNWKKFGEVKAAGKSAENKDYSLAGRLPEGLYQFRLKQVFIDRNFSYSPIKQVNTIRSNASLFSFSILTRKIVFTSLNSSNYQVRLVDLSGKAIFMRSLSSATSEINLPPVTPGIYILCVNSTKGDYKSQKILIN